MLQHEKEDTLTLYSKGDWWAIDCWQLCRYWDVPVCLHRAEQVRRPVFPAAKPECQRSPAIPQREDWLKRRKSAAQPEEECVKWRNGIVNGTMKSSQPQTKLQMIKNLPQGFEMHYPPCFHTLHQRLQSPLCLTTNKNNHYWCTWEDEVYAHLQYKLHFFKNSKLTVIEELRNRKEHKRSRSQERGNSVTGDNSTDAYDSWPASISHPGTLYML